MGDPYLGQISMIGFGYTPRHWAFCRGQILEISANQALFTLLGANFGGNGINTFGLPDFRGRTPIGSSEMGQGPGLSFYQRGETGGLEIIPLHLSQIPAHTHEASASGEVTSINAKQPAYNNNGESINPGTNMVPAIGNSGSAMSATQTKNYSSNTPDTALKNIEISADISVNVVNSKAGGSQPHLNMQPFTAINYVIAMSGLYPPRN